MARFGDQVQSFGKRAESRLRAVARTAVQDTVARAQRTRGEGGRLPVDTGFLRASIQAALHTMPSGPTQGKKDAKYPKQVAGDPVAVTLLRWDPTTPVPLFVGWTAVYSPHMEAKYSFLQGAVELWDQIVRRAAKKAAVGFE